MKNTAILSFLMAFATVQIIAVPVPYGGDSSETDATGDNTFDFSPKSSPTEQGEDTEPKIQQSSYSKPDTLVVRPQPPPVFTHLPAQPIYTPLNPQIVSHHVHSSIIEDAYHKTQLRQHFAQNQEKFKKVGKSLQQLHGMVKNAQKKTDRVIKETKDAFAETHSVIKKEDLKLTDKWSKVINRLNELTQTVDSNAARFDQDLHATNEEVRRVEQSANTQIANAVRILKELQTIVTNPLQSGAVSAPIPGVNDNTNGDSDDLVIPTSAPE